MGGWVKGVMVLFYFFNAGDLDKRIQHKHLNQVLLCLPCQEDMADKFKAFQGHIIVIPFFPEQKTLSESATFQVTVFFRLKQQKTHWKKSLRDDIRFSKNFAPPFIFFPFRKFFRTRPTSWSSWTMTWATGRLTPLVVQSIRRPCRNWPLMVYLGDVRGGCGVWFFGGRVFFVLKWNRVRTKKRKPCWFGKLFFLGGWSRKPFHSKFSIRKFWSCSRFGGISRYCNSFVFQRARMFASTGVENRSFGSFWIAPHGATYQIDVKWHGEDITTRERWFGSGAIVKPMLRIWKVCQKFVKPSTQSVWGLHLSYFTIKWRDMVKENLAPPQVTYNRFHTTAICSPTRASLLLGYDENLGKRCSLNGGVSYTYRGMCQKYFRAKVLSGIIQCKCMVILGFLLHSALFGLVISWPLSSPIHCAIVCSPWSCEYSR